MRRVSKHKLLTTVAWTRNGVDGVRARRQRVHRRRGRAVAARRARHHPIVERRRGARRYRCPTTATSISCPRSPGSARRTGIQYARGTIVGLDARHDGGPHRPRGARVHRLSVGGSARCDAGRCGNARRRASRRWRRSAQRSADAVPVRSDRRTGGASSDHGNDGAWCGLSGGSGRRILEERRRNRQPVARRIGASNRRWRPRKPVSCASVGSAKALRGRARQDTEQTAASNRTSAARRDLG